MCHHLFNHFLIVRIALLPNVLHHIYYNYKQHYHEYLCV